MSKVSFLALIRIDKDQNQIYWHPVVPNFEFNLMATSGVLNVSTYPDWHYVLQEFYNAYHYGSAGGSVEIRRHLRQVQQRISQCVATNPEIMFPIPEAKPVCAHLGRALDNGEQERTQSFIRALAKITGQLFWQYGYDKMPRSLEKKYAYAEILGPRGPVKCENLILGLVLFAPKCTYPAHSHQDITESYLCLSGAVSENHAGVYPPGSMLLNQAGREHAISTSGTEPVLLTYAWVGETSALHGFEMTFLKGRVTTTTRK
jgi:dimethylpropiothetin dethiomethylase